MNKEKQMWFRLISSNDDNAVMMMMMMTMSISSIGSILQKNNQNKREGWNKR